MTVKIANLTTAELQSIAGFDIVQAVENVCASLSRDLVANDAQSVTRAAFVTTLHNKVRIIGAVWASGIDAADAILNP